MKPTILAITLLLAATPLLGQTVFDPFAAPSGGTAEPGAEAPAPEAPPPPVADPEKELGFTWWNDVPALIQRGNEYFTEKDFGNAEIFYQDGVARDPDNPISALNQGIARGRQERFEEAEQSFARAADLAGEDAELRAEAEYNRALSQFKQALDKQEAARDLKDRKKQQAMQESAAERAFSAIESFDRALERRPDWEEANKGRTLAQHFLEAASQPPPEEQDQQQQSQDQGEGEQQQQGDPQDSQNQGQPQDQQQQPQGGEQPPEQEQQQPQDKQEEQEQQSPGEQEKEEEQEGGSEPQQGGSGGEQQDGQPLTPEQAQQMLELLGDEEKIQVRPRQSNKPKPEKDW
jgi:hypothetical protein